VRKNGASRSVLASGRFFPLAIVLLCLAFLIPLFFLRFSWTLAHALRVHLVLIMRPLFFPWLGLCVAHLKLLSTHLDAPTWENILALMFSVAVTMHQRPSRCWTCANVSAAISDRRRPQPRITAVMARSRSPFAVEASGALNCFSHVRCQPLTRAPVSPLSAASAASLRIAGMRMIWMRSRARGPPTVCNVHLKYDGLAGSPNATAGIEQPVWDWTKGKFTYPSPRRLPTPKAKSMRSIRRRGRSLGSS
jgi:hypothetical protein